MKKIKLKPKIRKIKKDKLLHFLRWRNWYPTIFFAAIVLPIAVYIWWDAFYDSKPPKHIIQKVESERVDFDQMGKRIREAIDILKERERNYLNPPDLSQQREMFFALDKDGNPIKEEPAEDPKEEKKEEFINRIQ